MVSWVLGVINFLSKLLPVFNFIKKDMPDKIVDLEYPKRSGLSDQLQKDGYKLGWAREDNLLRKLSRGAEIVYEYKCGWWRQCPCVKGRPEDQILIKRRDSSLRSE